MRAVQLVTEGKIPVLGEVQARPPRADEVLVKVGSVYVGTRERSSVSGNRANYWPDRPKPGLPIILGYQAGGTVVQAGADSPIKEGRRVFVNGFVDCGKCDACMDGQQNLCPHHSLLGIDVDGCLAEQVTLPWRCVFPCPDSIPMKLIPAVSEVSTALHGFRCAGSVAGRSVAVIGGGDIGATAAKLAKLFGAKPVVVVEPAEEPRARLKRILPDLDIRDSAKGLPAEFDFAFEASNVAAGIEDSIACLRRNGKAIIFSALGETTLRFKALYSEWHTREIQIIASNAKTPVDVRDSIDLLACHAELRAAFDLEPVAMEGAAQVIADFAAYKRRVPVCVFPAGQTEK